MSEGLRPETIAARGVHGPDPVTGAVAPAIVPATTYARDADYAIRGPATNYSRYGTPTTAETEETLAALDGGAEARLFASGMAAIVALLETVPHGRHVVAQSVMYHGTRTWLERLAAEKRIALSLFDPADPGSLGRAIRPGETDLVWVETPVNPVWDIVDMAEAARLAHAAGAILAVDSTGASPAISRPLDHGADVVFHSATKYLNGHSDVLAGVLVTKAKDARWEAVCAYRSLAGAVLAPFEAWLLQRGVRTLFVRVRQQSETALHLARHFEHHPALAAVLYPGLQSHPGHAVARRQMTAFGGMMSVQVKGGMAETGRVIRALKVFVPATSLGGVESLAEHRKVIEGPGSPVADNLIRLSIGLEAPDDLVADLEQALKAV
ncbi:MAG: PLP-dependent aspartate aminotransferase family protein [Hyphomicrobiales bacterium]